ncbi:hypothetical protein UFOVP606_43 [uncultured Caudovirales phage]|uniref:Uncharacterized protein n=1 Tax=uncultured Caudovirales phage TaxID=2100421 RepID=A0A6J5N307_9CAUD|nr:hypothetical protein UFOVP606_43 [uncultured Caudovirales phage]
MEKVAINYDECIKNLVQLAEMYHEYGKLIRLPQTVNRLDKEGVYKIYFADDYKTCCVYFSSIEIRLYSENIAMPYKLSVSELDKIHEQASLYYTDILIPETSIKRIESIALRKIELEKLELKLQNLREELINE